MALPAGVMSYSDQYAYKPVLTGEAAALPDGSVAVGEPYDPEPHGCAKECQGIAGVLCTWINILLVFVPLGIYSHVMQWSAAARFSCNFVAIVPLAAILGASTESLAAHTGQMIGGLLNATFGNAVEMIVTVNAIKAGLVTVVQGSLLGGAIIRVAGARPRDSLLQQVRWLLRAWHRLVFCSCLLAVSRGSILSNMLLVLGMSFFAAGIVEKESRFSAKGASANMTCLTLGSIALALPTIYNCMENTPTEDRATRGRLHALHICDGVCHVFH